MTKKLFARIVCAFLVIVMALGLTACSNTDKPNNGGDDGGDITPTTYTVTFDVQGVGVAPAAQTVNAGEKATKPADPVAVGYTFGGWFKESGCTNDFDFASQVISANTTVYAKWAKIQLDTDKTPTLYLAGDSTVQTYEDGQFIAGWGQYLGYFLDQNVQVVNAARGGRSSRSFINEGRLFEGEEYKYNFSENGGKSIESCIKAGDFLFVQFGHNDDNTKSGDSMADRMTPLGTPDANGIYPVTAPTGKQATTYLPASYQTQFASSVASKKAEIAKYGDTYYAYDCGGTFKWFLKQYIDLAREKGATPVLVTPVARVKYKDGEIIGGAGLHGENFAYVQAVRQLAQEENCLLIDLFNDTKQMLETVTATYGNYLMAIVPNSKTGAWPADYDKLYGNVDLGFEKVEATHYNKYGAYLSAAKIAEGVIKSAAACETKGADGKEYFNFASHVKSTPSAFIDPSNLMSKVTVGKVEGLFSAVNPVNPNRVYPDPAKVVAEIETLVATAATESNYEAQAAAYAAAYGAYQNLNIDDRSAVTNFAKLEAYGVSLLNAAIKLHLGAEITAQNYKQFEPVCKSYRAQYDSLGDGYKALVTNISILEAAEAAIKSFKPVATKTVVVCASDITAAQITTSFTVEGIAFTCTSDMQLSSSYKGRAFEYNDSQYAATTQCLYFAGNSGLTGSSPKKYIEFTVDKACTVTIVAESSGADERTVALVNAEKQNKGNFPACAKGEQKLTTVENVEAGTYRIGSTGKNIAVYYIIIEFFA